VQASLIEMITNHGGLDSNKIGNIFAFRGEQDLFDCRAAMPIWARSLGPVSAALHGAVPQPYIATAQVIRATNKIIPDVVIDFFFQLE
jgi:hypothetical protein